MLAREGARAVGAGMRCCRRRCSSSGGMGAGAGDGDGGALSTLAAEAMGIGRSMRLVERAMIRAGARAAVDRRQGRLLRSAVAVAGAAVAVAPVAAVVPVVAEAAAALVPADRAAAGEAGE